MRYKLLLSAFFAVTSVFSGEDPKQLTFDFYADLNKGDSLAMASYFHSNCHVKHVGPENVWDLELSEFLEVAAKFENNHFAEEVRRVEVAEITQGLTYVDVYFDFYIEGAYSHSGMDHFCWTIREGKFKIESVYSTDFKDGQRKLETEEQMNEMMLKWHNDAAIADYEAYMGFMNSDFIYLGTDPSERWTKQTFGDFCQPYFNQKATWDFKTNWRNWYFSEDKNMAWFEESLATQMEECRGSGVLVRQEDGWKIAHYNLSVVIENEKMKKFIKLRRK